MYGNQLETPLDDATKNKIGGTNETKSSPKVVQFDGMPHHKYGKRNKHQQRYPDLQDLELGKRQCLVADPVSRDVYRVFEERNTPAEKRGYIPGFVIPLL